MFLQKISSIFSFSCVSMSVSIASLLSESMQQQLWKDMLGSRLGLNILMQQPLIEGIVNLASDGIHELLLNFLLNSDGAGEQERGFLTNCHL